MDVSLARPRVGELFFSTYSRLLHPELFEVQSNRAVVRDGYSLAVGLTRTGHLASWNNGRDYLTEVIATAEMALPQAGRKIEHRFDGERRGRFTLASGIRYQISSQVEVLPAEQFIHHHAELASEGARKGLVFHCQKGDRLGLAPLGIVIVQSLRAGLSMNAFHTFPDERAVVRTQSLIEWD